MTPEAWQRVKEVFAAARALPAVDRAGFLDRACGTDATLRTELESLLTAADASEPHLSTSPPLATCQSCRTPLPREAAFCPGCGAATPTEVSRETGEIRTALTDDTPEREHVLRLQRALGKAYELREVIGRGGFGTVYSAWDVRLERQVAVKALRHDLLPTHSLVEQFEFEAKAAAKLRHSNIVPIYSVGEGDGLAFMIMPLIEGESLEALLDRERQLSVEEARRMLAAAARALDAAHQAGIVHRDIKPANILLEGPSRGVLLTDFGIAKAMRAGHTTITGSGLIAGTPQYMSPEQAAGAESIDHRADIYSLGIIGFRLLTGRLPFEGVTSREVMIQHITAPVPNLAEMRPDVPRAIAAAVMRCLEKNPTHRWNSMAAFAAVLEAEPSGHATEATPGEDPALREIAAAVSRSECVLFIGMSMPVVASTGSSLTPEHALCAALLRRLRGPAAGQRLPQVTQQLEMERGRQQMLAALREAIGDPQLWPLRVIERMADVHFPVVVSTGFDHLLETELARGGRTLRRVVDCRSISDDASATDLIVRLFGSLDQEDSVIVTEDDLWEFFDRFDRMADALKAILATRTLVFLGYDIGDETFRHLYSQVMRLRPAGRGSCYLVGGSVQSVGLRWSERKGLRLVGVDPAEFLDRLAALLKQEGETSAESAVASPLPSRPYKFLNYYEENDERIFFGRTPEIRTLCSKIHAHPLNVLYAPSGSGKTSLIHAGLMPRLKRDGYVPAYARVYDDPEGAIRLAVLHATGSAGAGLEQTDALELLLPQLAGRIGRPLVVFLDQLEEIFIRYDHEYRRRFAQTVQRCLAASGGRVRFVFALREDYLPRLAEFRQQIPGIFHNEFRLEPLGEASAREAIVAPARLFGLDVEPQLQDRLVSDLALEGIDPPQLQIVCDMLYDSLSPDDKVIGLKAYRELGEARRILARYLERVLNELPPEERRLTRDILKHLVTSEETKTVTRVEDIGRRAGAAPEQITVCLAELSERRLVRRLQREDGYWYELTHEYLVEEIRGWLSGKEREVKKVRELLEQAVRNHRHLRVLMPSAQVRLVRAHEADLNLNKEEVQVLKASGEAHQWRRKLVALATSAAVAALAIVGAISRLNYLRHHQFVQSADRELRQVEYGQPVNVRIETILLYRGSPARWWFDRLFGFPRLRYETDFALDQLQLKHRDAIKAGLMFGSDIAAERKIFEMLKPAEQVKRLVLYRSDSAVVEALALYHSPSQQDVLALDSLTTFLAHSGLGGPAIRGAAVAHAIRPGTPSFTINGLSDRAAPLVPLLVELPAESTAQYMGPLLASSRTISDGLALLGRLGSDETTPLLAPFLRDADPGRRQAAVVALAMAGGCSELPVSRRLVRDQDLGDAADQAIEIVRQCGGPADMALLESVARSDPRRRPVVLRAVYAMGGRAALPVIDRILSSGSLIETNPWGASSILQNLDAVPDAQAIPFVLRGLGDSSKALRAESAEILARRGRLDGLATAAAVAFDSTEADETRATAVGAFMWFAGANVRSFLLGLLDTRPPVAVRAAALRALRWYDDDTTVARLVASLADSDVAVRWAVSQALRLQTASPTRVTNAVRRAFDTGDDSHRVYAARVIQAFDTANVSRFYRALLETGAITTTDLSVLTEAFRGLRASYLGHPDSAVVRGLESPSRYVRLAAVLAIVDRHARDSDTAAVGDRFTRGGHAVGETAYLAQWALNLGRRITRQIDAAAAAAEQGQLARASQLLTQTSLTGFEASAFAGVLPVLMRGDRFPPVLSPDPLWLRRDARMLEAGLEVRQWGWRGPWRHLEQLISEEPTLRATIADDPRFSRLVDFYQFRVLVGLERPRSADGVKLPGAPESVQP